MYKSVLPILVLTLVLFSCKKKEKPVTQPDETPIVTQVEGVYQGELPCDDCEALLVSLKLAMDNSVLATMAEVGKDGTAVSKYGSWHLENRNVNVTIGNEVSKYYYTDLGNLKIDIDGKSYVLERLTDK